MKGLTLIEGLIGIALFSIIFLGIFGAFQLGFRMLAHLERKITAIQIGQGEIEKIKNLPYLQVGVIDPRGDESPGILERSTTTLLNGVEYTVERKIIKIADEKDGLEEECPVDYKRVEIKVSFSGILKGELTFTTDIMPKDVTEELRFCQENPTGILNIQVFNSKGEFISFPTIEIFDGEELEIEKAPLEGKYTFPLVPKIYKVIVSKLGYSAERTFGTEEIANPLKPHPLVLEGRLAQLSFSIDKLSSLKVKTFSTYGQGIFSDSFDNEEQISEKFNVLVSGGNVSLATSSEGYLSNGYFFSKEISPSDLIEWQEFSFFDSEVEGTDLKYQIFYSSGTDWFLIPDSVLPHNSQGFDSSPVSLKNLSTTTYSRLKLKAIFSSNSPLVSPRLFDWHLSWKNTFPIAIGGVTFSLRGEKILGKDLQENLIYKFSTTTQTNVQGEVLIPNLEWDLYYVSNIVKNTQSLDLIDSEPSHPIDLQPDQNLEVNLYLGSQHSLLVTVLDSETLKPIFPATVSLSSQNFSQTQETGSKGETIFLPLSNGTYDLHVQATNYYSTSSQVFVSGKTTKVIKLIPSE